MDEGSRASGDARLYVCTQEANNLGQKWGYSFIKIKIYDFTTNLLFSDKRF